MDLFGHTGVVLKGDGEPALVQVQSSVNERRAHPTICQNPPACRQRLNVAVKTEREVLEWMVELSTVFINRCLVDHEWNPSSSPPLLSPPPPHMLTE